MIQFKLENKNISVKHMTKLRQRTGKMRGVNAGKRMVEAEQAREWKGMETGEAD